MRAREQGFTLVEMAIVLTIIALIISGILVGKDMIHNSELKSVVTDFNRYRNAMKLFQEKYKALPGDMSNATSFWATAGNGNGDGFITASRSNITTLYSTGNAHLEALRAWQHLANAGLIEGQYSGAVSTPSDYSVGVNVPKSRLGGNTFTMFYATPTAAAADYFAAAYKHVMVYGAPSTLAATVPTYNPALTTLDASDIDTKIDDGKPGLGQVLSYNGLAAVAGCVSSSTAYDTSTNSPDPKCSLIFITGF